MKGYVAVQRKLLTIIYALWKKDTKYDATFVSEVQKKVAPTEEATRHQPQGAVLEEVNIGELAESWKNYTNFLGFKDSTTRRLMDEEGIPLKNKVMQHLHPLPVRLQTVF